MQTSVENTSDIGRKLTVQVPEEKIQEEITSRLKKLARQIKLDGFRPGKAPARVVRQRFGQQVRQEVISDLIDSSFREALEEHMLRIAGEPQLTPKEMTEGKGLAYEVQFEVYPEIELSPIEELEIKKWVCEIREEDLDAMIEKLREQKKIWEETDQPAQSGDRITMDFEGTLNGEPIEGGKAENFELELGKGQMIPGFEDHLLGARAGDQLEFDITFPEDYQDENLAGKPVHFKVEVKKVEQGRLPEIDADFIHAYGVESGDVDEFRNEVRENMARQLQKALRERLQAEVLDRLYEHNPIPVPEALIKQEMQRTLEPLSDALKKNPELLNQLPLDNIRENARKRVALGLLLGHILRSENIKPDPEKVRQIIEELAQNYENPQQVVEWYYNNPEQMAQIESQVLEQMAIEWIVERAKVTEESITFDDLTKPRQQEAG